jgi:formamidopyrimidine-DNA glycosylase
VPELPDVEYFKRYIDATSLHRRIERVEVRDRRVLEGVSPRRLDRTLRGHRFASSRRHGKHLGLRVGADGWLVLHFGMTGEPKAFEGAADEPPSTQVLVRFAGDRFLAYVSQRKLGRVRLVDDFTLFVEERRLGPDALALDLPAFRRLLAGRRGSIKSLLMNQKALAGIGNVYADEILFQARLHPKSCVGRVRGERATRLHRAMRRVLGTAAERKADPARMPRSWLLPRRDEDGSCPRCGHELATVKSGGRTSRLCPACQQQA